MLQSLMIRLETTKDDKAILLETMKRYNEACNFVAKRAYSLKLANKYLLFINMTKTTMIDIHC